MRYALGMSRTIRSFSVVLLAGFVAACAAEASTGKSVTPSNSGGGGGATEPPQIGAARAELEQRSRDVERAGSDCQTACKALASLERAANHLCLVSEPEECSDARVRVDRARRAIDTQCGGC